MLKYRHDAQLLKLPETNLHTENLEGFWSSSVGCKHVSVFRPLNDDDDELHGDWRCIRTDSCWPVWKALEKTRSASPWWWRVDEISFGVTYRLLCRLTQSVWHLFLFHDMYSISNLRSSSVLGVLKLRLERDGFVTGCHISPLQHITSDILALFLHQTSHKRLMAFVISQ